MRTYYLTILLAVILILTMGCGNRATSTPAAVEDLSTIKAQIDAGEYAQAKETLEGIVAQEEENAEAHFLLGLSYFNLGEPQKAREAFNRALELDPERAGAVHHNLGALAYEMGQLDKAEEEFLAALSAEPDDADTHYQLGATYLRKALPAEAGPPDADLLAQAQEQFETALELAPEKPEALVGLGNAYMLQNQFDEAIEVLEQAAALDQEMPEVLFALGRAYAQAGQREKAVEALHQFIETDAPEVWKTQAQQLLTQLGE
jgi:tetratricopeptide (TPR) repeat protein